MVNRYFTSGGIYPCDSGEWVIYDDYAELLSECERLRGVIAAAGWIVVDPNRTPEAGHDLLWNDGEETYGCVLPVDAKYWAHLCSKDVAYITHWRPWKVEE